MQVLYKKSFWLLLCICFPVVLMAQDLHFSQFYTMPLMTNPANTGRFREDFRLGAINRKQWATIGSDFSSFAATTDVNFRLPSLKKDKVGVGVVFYHDQMGEGIIKNNTVYLSGAYHRMLDLQRRHRLSVGFQAGYSQYTLNGENWKFPNQYSNFLYEPSLASNEAFTSTNFGVIDGQIGAIYSFVLSERTEFFTGLSLYQLRQPKQSIIYTSKENTQGTRYLYTLGLKQKLSEKIVISPQLMYMRQRKAVDFNAGAYVTLALNPSATLGLDLGAFYRNNDAFIPLVGIKYKNLDVKLTYDHTISSFQNIKNATNSNSAKYVGAWEISLIYTGFLPKSHPGQYTIPCGIF